MRDIDSHDVGSLVDLLWGIGEQPASLITGSATGSGRVVAEVAVVAPAGKPRVLLPPLPAGAMSRALTSYPGLRDPATRVKRRMVAHGVRARIPGWVRPARVVVAQQDPEPRSSANLAMVLQSHVPDADGCLLVLRPMDSHYKPTVQLLGPTGRVRAFAKLGWTEGTAPMVVREHDAVARHRAAGGRSGVVRAPATLQMGTHRGVPYHMTVPLPASVRRPVYHDPLPAAAKAIADAHRVAGLAATQYLEDTARRLAETGSGPLERAVLQALAESRDSWSLGAWHGDWVPWNLGLMGATVWAWDWEHSTSQVPLGFDVLHWLVTVPHVTAGVAMAQSSNAARERLLAQPDLVGPNASSPRSLDLLMAAYLLELRLRSAELARHDPARKALFPGLEHALQSAYNLYIH